MIILSPTISLKWCEKEIIWNINYNPVSQRYLIYRISPTTKIDHGCLILACKSKGGNKFALFQCLETHEFTGIEEIIKKEETTRTSTARAERNLIYDAAFGATANALVITWARCFNPIRKMIRIREQSSRLTSTIKPTQAPETMAPQSITNRFPNWTQHYT